ncbi:MAG: hypothetical protein Q9227_001863 [Pyrenula ochraceoflavens]
MANNTLSAGRLESNVYGSFAGSFPTQSYAPYETQTSPPVNGLQSTVIPFPDANLAVSRNTQGMQGVGDVLNPEFWDPNVFSINWLGTGASPIAFNEPVSPLSAATYQFQNTLQQPNDAASAVPVSERRLGSHPAEIERSMEASRFGQTNESSIASPTTVGSSVESSAFDDIQAEGGQFYVDGAACRLPRVKRRKVMPKLSTDQAKSGQFHFDLDCVTTFDTSRLNNSRPELSSHKYEELVAAFQQSCLTTQTGLPSFSSTAFPPREFLEYLLGLYLQHQHPGLPFLHIPTISDQNLHWLLYLAMVAIGSHFLDCDGADVLLLSFHEVVRRILFYHDLMSMLLPDDEMALAQIKILHLVGTIYSGSRLDQTVNTLRCDIADYCQEHWSGSTDGEILAPESQRKGSSQLWAKWRDTEERRRTGFCAWLVDTMLTFHASKRPICRLEDAKHIGLPCNEKLWRAPTLTEWESQRHHFEDVPTLTMALENLYVNKKLAHHLGEFARIILVHSIFRRTWQVETYVTQELSHWEPTAQKQWSAQVLNTSPIWPPSIPLYAKWRNSACDSLDVLHWSANAAIGAASGIEPPLVGHLHTARVVLLTPYEDIVNFAKCLAGSPGSTEAEKKKHLEVICKWVTRDQYKARLAMIHAGVTLWHIRRYTSNAFHEASSLALAVLALWAFSKFSVKAKLGTGDGDRSLDGESRSESTAPTENEPSPQDEPDASAKCNIILLDRPTDDELVQEFVRRGQGMHVHVSGVGDLYGPHAPERVLIEGRNLLASLTCWGIRREWMDLLQKLVHASRQNLTGGS